MFYFSKSTSSFDGLTITEGNKSGLIIGSTSALGMLADGELVPKSQVPGTKARKQRWNTVEVSLVNLTDKKSAQELFWIEAVHLVQVVAREYSWLPLSEETN